MLGICALCKKAGKLVNSHIIPEFLYGPLYDGLHRFRVVPGDPAERERFLQNGIKEYLLCADCDNNRLGGWENYAKTAFVDRKGVKIVQNPEAIAFSGLDYRTFKLFQLSLLWRMSVTERDFFKEVALGPHEDRIRLALLNDDPISPDDYPCHVVAVEINRKVYLDWITEPCLTRFDGHHIYWLVISGMMYTFYVGSHPAPPEMQSNFLNTKGEMRIPVYQSDEVPCLRNAIRSFRVARGSRAKR